MVEDGYKPNEFTFTFVLPACAGLKSVDSGRRVHDDVVLRGCESNVFVGTALVDMYIKCGELRLGRQVFDGMLERGTASYNAMIAGSVELVFLKSSFFLFYNNVGLHVLLCHCFTHGKGIGY